MAVGPLSLGLATLALRIPQGGEAILLGLLVLELIAAEGLHAVRAEAVGRRTLPGKGRPGRLAALRAVLRIILLADRILHRLLHDLLLTLLHLLHLGGTVAVHLVDHGTEVRTEVPAIVCHLRARRRGGQAGDEDSGGEDRAHGADPEGLDGGTLP